MNLISNYSFRLCFGFGLVFQNTLQFGFVLLDFDFAFCWQIILGFETDLDFWYIRSVAKMPCLHVVASAQLLDCVAA